MATILCALAYILSLAYLVPPVLGSEPPGEPGEPPPVPRNPPIEVRVCIYSARVPDEDSGSSKSDTYVRVLYRPTAGTGTFRPTSCKTRVDWNSGSAAHTSTWPGGYCCDIPYVRRSGEFQFKAMDWDPKVFGFGNDDSLGSANTKVVCDNSCDHASDDQCDDGGPGSDFSVCDQGTGNVTVPQLTMARASAAR
jgi:hypothetical protein